MIETPTFRAGRPLVGTLIGIVVQAAVLAIPGSGRTGLLVVRAG